MQTELERQVAELIDNRYWREEDARLALNAWAESGVSLTVFARRTKIHPRRLSRWAEAAACGQRPR
ncbi:MAG TPA: hypothetical protein VGK67_39660 [Myxococcales bacterium]|jgi:hypothetical protein